MASVKNLYDFAVNHDEAAKLVATNGQKLTYVFEGTPGIGKSSLLKTLKTMLKDKKTGEDVYDFIYIDVPMKDIPDIALSMPNHETKTTMAYVHEIWRGTDPKKPKVIMLDEVFKGTDYVKLMMNRLMLERVVGDYELPEGSLVFGTTNFQSDGVGDRTNGHTNSRISRVPMRGPTLQEWTSWGVDNKIHEVIQTWVNQNPALFTSYKETEFDAREFKDGVSIFHYIYHPQHNSMTYVCPRTLELASHQLHNIDITGEALLTKGLIGTFGAKAALDLSALIALGADLPHPDDIVADPKNARIPKSAPARLMMVYKSMQYITQDTLDKYVEYFQRFDAEMTATWIKTLVNSATHKGYAYKDLSLRKYAIENSWVLGGSD